MSSWAGRWAFMKKKNTPGWPMSFVLSARRFARGFPFTGFVWARNSWRRRWALACTQGEGKKEIGWFPVDLTPQAQGDPLLGDEEPSFPVFQWHGDTFDIPRGRRSSGVFRAIPAPGVPVGGARSYAFQFHLEIGAEDISTWLDAFEGDMNSPRSDADAQAIIERCAGAPEDFEQARCALVRALARTLGA